jgi:7-keto-8-aminopelargonate synthetase-like enzyme
MNNINLLKLKETDQIGLIRKRCIDNGITKIGDIAHQYQKMRDLQAEAGFWFYENFTEDGSNSSGTVSSDASSESKQCVIFTINHYLGLNRNPDVIQAAVEATQKYGTGCGTSAVGGGQNRLHKILEKRLAQVMNKEAAILFPTGYSANLGAVSALARGSNTVVLFDRECHASIIDGVKLGGCDFFPFKHNDVQDLEKKLKAYSKKYENVFVIVESVYSMSGDESPLNEIVNLKKAHSFYFFVDEAHAFGLYDVGGLCHQLGISSDVDFIMTTLSKSTASIGGVVATSQEFATFFLANANAYMFQAVIPPADTATILAALDIIESKPELRQSLWDKTAYFRNELVKRGFDTGKGKTPIVPVFVRDSDVLFKMGKSLADEGVFTTSVTFPLVKQSEVRFRFIVNESHSYEQLDYTIAVLEKLAKQFKII